MPRRHQVSKRAPKRWPQFPKRRKPFKPDPNHPRCPATDKLGYKTMTSAEAAIKDIVLNGSATQRAYRTYKCPHCPYWHLSSHPRPKEQK